MMRLLVSSSPWALPRSIPAVFSELLDRGVELVFGAETRKDPVPHEVSGHPRVRAAALPLERRAADAEALTLFRRITDLVRFLDPDLAAAEWPRRRTALRALVRAGHSDAEPLAARFANLTLPQDVHGNVTGALTRIERLLPPDPALVEAIGALDVDAIVLVSRCSLGGAERDVLKAARAVGVPTIMLVWSWDNLSSKALLNEHPDHLLVWNERQVDEAAELHGIPRERVHALGAPSFDAFFAELAALSTRPREDGATVLYLGSSKNISRREPEIFEAWVRAVRAAPDERLRESRIVVRPYPGGGAWSRWQPPPSEEFVVEPARKLEPARLARLLHGADAVVALNTSAELEAALAGKPVVTFRAGELAPGQSGSIHFEYLLERNGGFVVDSGDLDEHVRNLARVLRGEHDRERARRFVERFVRPAGLDRPVAPLVAAKILELAAAQGSDRVAAEPAAVVR